MRLIDADILEDELRDSVSDNSTAISILNEAPTVQAIPIGVLDKIKAELHATAEMHEDKDYYLREEWIDEIIDKYKAERSSRECTKKI